MAFAVAPILPTNNKYSIDIYRIQPKTLGRRSPIFVFQIPKKNSSCLVRQRMVASRTTRTNGMLSGSDLVKRQSTSRSGWVVTHAGADDSSAPAQEPAGVKLEGSAATLKVLPAVAVSLMGAFLFGYHLGVVNGALQYLARDIGISGSTLLQGLVVSITLAGATFGSLVGGTVNDMYGRCKAFMVAAIPCAIGGLLCATAQSSTVMLLARFLCGAGIGLSSTIVPVYISEISPPAVRGALGSYNQLFICFGILAALIAGLPLAGGQAGWWRVMFGLSVIPAGLLGLGAFFIPESPRWLAKQGRIKEAQEAGVTLWGACDQQDLGGGAAQMESGQEETADASWAEALSPRYRKGVLLGIAMFFFQQMAGINAVIYFSSSVFRAAGVQSDVLASAGVGLVNVIATVAAGGVIDRLGRKPLLVASFSGMAVSMLLLAMAMSVPALAAIKGTLCVGGTMAYIMFFGIGVGPVPALLVGEIMSSRIRGKGASASMMSHWFFNFCIGQAFLEANRMFGVTSIYIFFATVCMVAVMFVQTNLVETKGRSLEEIEQAMLSSN
mmetsp:Transcript_24521/g.33814  ORF Transcript_24521/g.33814 Transcript_24521/m.33814 type:complete len:554 (+) Transcript_24521:139-1800(+)|eukprot:CAMPEP_0196588512 /NCGR_PEP_ID=MMETSP1081-20130531/60718_1 /TAXON_ID=36882 /ORGANISM="Pyramimonas amylifera, Strain CCMP720" /LENGTH=553 /DNA_ID=CAMNT_0041911017 /DNA_START=80 /DNA_END=1741 /DNA_ORIENTATION=+